MSGGSKHPMLACAMPDMDADGLTMPPFPAGAMRLGFPVKVMGRPDLKSNDTRRWQQGPHLRVSLGYLCEIFAYLRQHDIRMYRMSSELAPYHTHPRHAPVSRHGGGFARRPGARGQAGAGAGATAELSSVAVHRAEQRR